MSYVAGIILLHCGPPEDCFRVFCNLLNSQIIQSFYNFELSKINKVYKVFWKLLKENIPQYYTNLRSDNTSCRNKMRHLGSQLKSKATLWLTNGAQTANTVKIKVILMKSFFEIKFKYDFTTKKNRNVDVFR